MLSSAANLVLFPQDVVLSGLADPAADLLLGSNGSSSSNINGHYNRRPRRQLQQQQLHAEQVPASSNGTVPASLPEQQVQLRHAGQPPLQQQPLHLQQQQQEHPLEKLQLQPQRMQRQWSSMRNWQWLASQLQFNSSNGSSRSSTSLQTLVSMLTQLSQPGVGPSQHDKQQQQRFRAFLAQLLLAVQQQLQAAAVAGDAAAAAAPDDVTDLLWGLAKLRVQPQWSESQPQQQPQQQQQQLLSPGRLPAAQVLPRRVAEVAAAAVHCLTQHLQQQQQWGSSRGGLYSPRQLALCGWALAKIDYPMQQQQEQSLQQDLQQWQQQGPLQQQQQHPFWDPYLSAVQQQLHECCPQDLANIVWALSQLGCQPGAAWMDAYLAAAHQAFCSSSSSGQALAVVMLSLAQLGEQPPAGWIDAVLTSLLHPQQQQQQLGRQRQQQHRHQRWQQHPHDDSSQHLLLHQLNGQALGSMLGALAIWRHRPSDAWLEAVQGALLYCLERCNGQDVAHIAWKLATLMQLPSSSSSSSSSLHLSGDEQETGLALLQRQFESNSSSLFSWPAASTVPQHQHQHQHQQRCVQPELLQELAHRLAETAHSTAPCMVAQGMWGIAKLYQQAQPAAEPWPSIHAGKQEQHWPSQHVAGRNSSSSSSSRQQSLHQELQQHWQPCRAALLHCAAALQQRQALNGLDCKQLSLIAWGLALAGGNTLPSQQQQQRRQQDSRNCSLGGSSSTSRGSSRVISSRFTVPHQFAQQILDASRASLAAAEPHSQALLLCAAVHLQLQPSWQWLLGFYEATEPQLNRCSAQDLSMIAAALAQLQVRPLGSWLGRFLGAFQTLAEAQHSSVTPGCLVSVVQAVAAPCLGLAAGSQNPSQGQLQQQQQQLELLSPGWTAAVQQQVMQLLPQLSLHQVVVLLRAASKLGWAKEGPASSSIDGGVPRGTTAVAGLLAAAAERVQQQQQHTQSLPSQTAEEQLQQLLQLSAAVVALPAAAVPADWWLWLAQQLNQTLTQQQQQQQEHVLADCTAYELCSSMRTLTAVIRKVQQHQQLLPHDQQQQQHAAALLCCSLDAVVVAAAQQAQQLPINQSLQLVAAATDSMQRLAQASAAPNSHASVSTGEAAGCAAAVQKLRGSVQLQLQQQLPRLSLHELACVLQQASQLGLLLACTAAPTGHAAEVAKQFAQPGDCLMQVTVTALQQLLQDLEAQQQQQQQEAISWHHQQQQQQNQLHMQPLQQQQQQLMYRGASFNDSSSNQVHVVTQLRMPAVSAAAAGQFADILAAFARSSYRPPSKLLRRLVAAIQPSLEQMAPAQLYSVAAAGAALQLRGMVGQQFRGQYWLALAAMLRSQQQQQLVRRPGGVVTSGAAAAAAAGSTDASAGMRSRRGMSPAAAASATSMATTSSMSSTPGSDSSHSTRVLLTLRALNTLAAGTPSSSSKWSNAPVALDVYSGCALGAPPPRRLIELAFSAAAGVLPQLSSSPAQQVLLLQLLVPLAARLSAKGLRGFYLRVRQQLQLQLMPELERCKARAALQQLVECWRAGKQRREGVVQRQRLLKRQREQRMQLLAASCVAGGPDTDPAAEDARQQQQQHEERAEPVVNGAAAVHNGAGVCVQDGGGIGRRMSAAGPAVPLLQQ
jgi:hypothetical protein